jgi:glc operon protein GlcG
MEALTLPVARLLVDRALAKAKQDFNRPICVAVCDASGFLLAFARMDGAPTRSIQISQRKAYSAVIMGVSTDAFLARLQKENLEIGYFCDPCLTALPGGNLLRDKDGKARGAVGVSGLALAEDQAITEFIAELFHSGQFD